MNPGKVFKIACDVVFVSGLALAGLLVFLHLTDRKPVQIFIVSSGSMEPAISTGSIVLVAPQPSYTLGDIVTFYNSPDEKSTSTHRVVGINDQFIRTAGDANEEPDPSLTPIDRVVGKVLFSIPYLGFLAAFAKTPKGFILLVIVPATIIIYEELKGLLNELKKVLRQAQTSKPHPGGFPSRPAIIIPIFLSALAFGSLTVTFFVDRETSTNNTLGRADSITIPTPTPVNDQ